MKPEASVINEIFRALGTRPWLRIWRQNTGGAVLNGRFVRFGLPGQADITGILPGGRRLEIECKTRRGRQSKNQKNFQRMIEKFGGIYILARSAAEVEYALKNWGAWHE